MRENTWKPLGRYGQTLNGHQIDVGQHLVAIRWSQECEVQPKAHHAKTRCLKDKEYKQHSSNKIKYFK
jgi:hypothetical protein